MERGLVDRRLGWLVWLAACQGEATPEPARPADTDDVAPVDTDRLDLPDDTDPPEDTDVVVPPDVSLALGAQVVCADPAARLLAPLSAPITGGDWGNQPFDPARTTRFTGGGISAADLDGDGRVDLIRPDLDRVRVWTQTTPLVFTDASDALPDMEPRNNVVTPVDVDGDGDLDLFVGRQGAANRLWVNDGQGGFTDGTAAAGLDQTPDAHTTSAAFADFDLDGDLDLLVSNYGEFRDVGHGTGEPKVLWRNRGDGTFEDRSALLPQSVHDGFTFVVGWWDPDRDRWPDLYVVNDFGQYTPNLLVRNSGGAFALDPSVGLDVAMQGMGLGVGDLNEDGVDDLTVAGWGLHRVLVSSGGAWFDARGTMGFKGDLTRRQIVAWSSELADLDNDGDLDVAQGFGFVAGEDAPPRQPDELYRHDGAVFTRVGQAWGFANEGDTRGVLAVDLNGDGWLDLLRADMTGPATAQLAACGEEAWLEVSVRDARALNRLGVGVELRATAGAHTWSRTIVAGGRSLLSAGPPVAHFGLGMVDQLDALTVLWPDGEVTVFEDVSTRRAVVVSRVR